MQPRLDFTSKIFNYPFKITDLVVKCAKIMKGARVGELCFAMLYAKTKRGRIFTKETSF